VGQKVQAYNPLTKTTSLQTVQQVFLNQDTDRIDVTLAVHPAGSRTKPQQVAMVSHGSQGPPVQIETIHTTQKHPWLTTRGWIPAGHLHLGDQVQQLDGATATVVGLKLIAGTAAMYDLTVSNVHTFAVGNGQFVVHNCGSYAMKADMEAKGLWDEGITTNFGKNRTTVGVAYVQDEGGNISRLVSMNSGSMRSWGARVQRLINPNEWVK